MRVVYKQKLTAIIINQLTKNDKGWCFILKPEINELYGAYKFSAFSKSKQDRCLQRITFNSGVNM